MMTDQLLTLIRKAVILRLQGKLWAEVATACDRAEGTCSNWPVEHREAWKKLWDELAPSIEDDAREFAQRALRRQEGIAESAKHADTRRQANASIMSFGSKAITQKAEIEHKGPLVVKFGKEPEAKEGDDGEEK